MLKEFSFSRNVPTSIYHHFCMNPGMNILNQKYIKLSEFADCLSLLELYFQLCFFLLILWKFQYCLPLCFWNSQINNLVKATNVFPSFSMNFSTNSSAHKVKTNIRTQKKKVFEWYFQESSSTIISKTKSFNRNYNLNSLKSVSILHIILNRTNVQVNNLKTEHSDFTIYTKTISEWDVKLNIVHDNVCPFFTLNQVKKKLNIQLRQFSLFIQLRLLYI